MDANQDYATTSSKKKTEKPAGAGTEKKRRTRGMM
jgi:hypothetical protein